MTRLQAARALAVASIVAALAFYAIGGAVKPGYSHLTQYISELNYDEVIEMAYYGAQVIHPKTIKPLFEKSIPLLVKCFLDPNLPGTVISKQRVKNLPPILVRKEQQVLVDFRSKDYSFVGEHAVGTL